MLERVALRRIRRGTRTLACDRRRVRIRARPARTLARPGVATATHHAGLLTRRCRRGRSGCRRLVAQAHRLWHLPPLAGGASTEQAGYESEKSGPRAAVWRGARPRERSRRRGVFNARLYSCGVGALRCVLKLAAALASAPRPACCLAVWLGPPGYARPAADARERLWLTMPNSSLRPCLARF